MDRYEAVRWLQKELEGERKASSLIDQLQEAWQTLDALGEYLLPEAVIALLLAHEKSSEGKRPTLRLDIGLGEFFALKAACRHYDNTLRSSTVGDEERIALTALEQLQQRLLTATVQPSPTEVQ
jgi:hypothetical protein